MAGKYLRRGAIVDTIKSEHRTNAIQKREGLTKHPVTVTSCGSRGPELRLLAHNQNRADNPELPSKPSSGLQRTRRPARQPKPGVSTGTTKKRSRKVFVGCSVSTDQGCFAELGAHRAPYDKATAASETVSKMVDGSLR